jgi:hypothetical protein
VAGSSSTSVSHCGCSCDKCTCYLLLLRCRRRIAHHCGCRRVRTVVHQSSTGVYIAHGRHVRQRVRPSNVNMVAS